MPIYEYVCDTCGRQFETEPVDARSSGRNMLRMQGNSPAGHFRRKRLYFEERRFRIPYSAALREERNLLRQQNTL